MSNENEVKARKNEPKMGERNTGDTLPGSGPNKDRFNKMKTDVWYVLPLEERRCSIYEHYHSNALIPTVVIEDEVYDEVARRVGDPRCGLFTLELCTQDKQLLHDFYSVKEFNVTKESHVNCVTDSSFPDTIDLLRARYVTVVPAGAVYASVELFLYPSKRAAKAAKE